MSELAVSLGRSRGQGGTPAFLSKAGFQKPIAVGQVRVVSDLQHDTSECVKKTSRSLKEHCCSGRMRQCSRRVASAGFTCQL